jgi:hypothetical protein
MKYYKSLYYNDYIYIYIHDINNQGAALIFAYE